MDTATLSSFLSRSQPLLGAPDAVIALCLSSARRFRLDQGEVLINAGAHTGSLYLLLSGTVEVRLPGQAGRSGTVAVLTQGDMLGEIQVVTGQASTADVIAQCACEVLELDRYLLQSIAQAYPPFEQRLTQSATQRLRKVIFRRTIDELLQEMASPQVDEFLAGASEVLLERGECLFRQGDDADAWYVLTSGRLSVTTTSADSSQRIGEIAPGGSVGEMALIAGGQRNATVRAERKASLMRLSRADFDLFADVHPAFARRLMSLVVRRIGGQSKARSGRGSRVLVALREAGNPLHEAALSQLSLALKLNANAAVCSRKSFEASVGCRIDAGITESHPVWNRFDIWLEEAQREYSLVLVDAGDIDDNWRRECLLHADQCLWLATPVAEGTDCPPAAALDEFRSAHEWTLRDTQKLPWSLLLTHPKETERPRNTRAWLANADFDRHFHLRLDDSASMARCARLLSGRGHGVALSGGGARGLAHIGALKAFTALGVPIDCIGGTSIGAIQAGMYALGLSVEGMERLNREVMAMRPFQEYTLPIVAMVASRRRDAGIRHSFGDIQIEDLWIPYLAVSTDLRAARAVVHERGSLGLAASASSSLPGVLVPVIDGERILVDGGIVNNLPADLVKLRCGGPVFGVKVAPDDDLVVPDGGFPSPWSVIGRKLLPGSAPLRTPKIGDLLMRTLTVSSAERMSQVAATVDLLIEPEVTSFGMLQFKAIDALVERGFDAATHALKGWLSRQESI